MSRGDRPGLAAVATVAAVAAPALAFALGGCMRIYPDPELPDIVVEWVAEDCAADTDRVLLTLSTIEPAAEVGAADLPCSQGGLTFADVARVPHQIAGRLVDAAGTERSGYDAELNLRDGRNAEVFMFFGGLPGGNFHVAWRFDMGATCAALSAATISLRASDLTGQPLYGFDAPCEAEDFVGTLPMFGTYTFSARAFTAAGTVVANSPESPPATVASGLFTEFGVLTLTPCGAACPP